MENLKHRVTPRFYLDEVASGKTGSIIIFSLISSALFNFMHSKQKYFAFCQNAVVY